MAYITNIIKKTDENEAFRAVLFTGEKSQLVVMSVPVDGEIGEETHEHVEQSFFFQSGTGEAILDGKAQFVGAGDVLIVTPGVRHNIVNIGGVPMKLYTLYAPPNHIAGRVHATKLDADADREDEEFGHAVR